MGLSANSSRRGRFGWLKRLLLWCGAVIVGLWAALAVCLVAFRWIAPPTTAVQIERRVQSWGQKKPYRKQYRFVPLGQISPDFQHAVVAAEDSRFYQHHGFDWHEMQIAIQENLDEGHGRGASTITQQLVKNLFFGTSRSFIRKGAEASLVPVAELILGKRRILELYLNVVEWGPGVYGAEAAAHYHYGSAARAISRDRGAKLAAILPSPLRWKPEHMNDYAAIILGRMAQMGW